MYLAISVNLHVLTKFSNLIGITNNELALLNIRFHHARRFIFVAKNNFVFSVNPSFRESLLFFCSRGYVAFFFFMITITVKSYQWMKTFIYSAEQIDDIVLDIILVIPGFRRSLTDIALYIHRNSFSKELLITPLEHRVLRGFVLDGLHLLSWYFRINYRTFHLETCISCPIIFFAFGIWAASSSFKSFS